jgi:hypothetical protein
LTHFELARCFALAFFAASLALTPARAQNPEGPIVPCGDAVPEFLSLGDPPLVKIWYGDDLELWTPPPCTGWEPIEFNVLIATSGRFEHTGTMAELLHRLGAVSAMRGVQYWSHTRETWRLLILDANALNSPNPEDIRGDFTDAELVPGPDHYIWQHENTPAGKLVYRLNVLERDDTRAVLGLENTEALKYLFVTVFNAGEYQFLYFFDRESDTAWQYYSLVRIGAGFNPLVREGSRSYINRSVAMFRHFADIPTNLEPPAAP